MMGQWKWIDELPATRTFLVRVLAKALVLFVLCNLVFAWLYPTEWLGQLSLYGVVYPARDRLPYGEDVERSYNLTLSNLSAMFASHAVSEPKGDEFRVVLLGDSNTWGWLLPVEQTLAVRINRSQITASGQPVVAYNLGYPVMSLTKDLLILKDVMKYEPDMIIWLVSLASFPPEQQLASPLVQENYARLARLTQSYDLRLDLNDQELNRYPFIERTIVSQRRQLADLIRLQTYGLSWWATGVDQYIPDHFELRQSDLEPDSSWQGHTTESTLTQDDLAYDVLRAGIALARDTPLVIVNEPIFVSTGQNSDIRYNSWYPRWAYDQYRDLLSNFAQDEEVLLLDFWDAIPGDEFTDSPVHLSPEGTSQLADLIIDAVFEVEE